MLDDRCFDVGMVWDRYYVDGYSLVVYLIELPHLFTARIANENSDYSNIFI